MIADLASQRATRALAEEFLERHEALHILVNNAGLSVPKRRLTEDGIETTFAVNHLAYFLLTNLLLDRLIASAPARIINVSSAAHTSVKLDFDNLQGEKGYRPFRAYSTSKLANVAFTYELARRLEGKGVTANCLHPGVIPKTNISRESSTLFKLLIQLASYMPFFMISPEEGAKTTVYLASSPEVEGVTGKYFVKSKAVKSSRASYDQRTAERLWRLSAELTKSG